MVYCCGAGFGLLCLRLQAHWRVSALSVLFQPQPYPRRFLAGQTFLLFWVRLLAWPAPHLLQFFVGVDDAVHPICGSGWPYNLQAQIRAVRKLTKSKPESVPALAARFSIFSFQLFAQGLDLGLASLLQVIGVLAFFLLVFFLFGGLALCFRLILFNIIRLTLDLVVSLNGVNEPSGVVLTA